MGGLLGLLFRKRNRERTRPLSDEHQLDEFEIKSYRLSVSDDEIDYESYNMIVGVRAIASGSVSSTQSEPEKEEPGDAPQQPTVEYPRNTNDKPPAVLADKYMLSQDQTKIKGNIIEEILQSNYPAMIEQMNPESTADCLYGFAIINYNECESAMLDKIPKLDRSRKLLLLLIRKLRWNPHWCEDAIVALKKGGVNMESIITALTDAGIDLKSQGKKIEVKKCDQDNMEIEVNLIHECTNFPGKDTSDLEEPSFANSTASPFKKGDQDQSPDQQKLCQDGQPSIYGHQDQHDHLYHNQCVKPDNHSQHDQPCQHDQSDQTSQYGQQDEHEESDPHTQVVKLDTVYEGQATPLRHQVQDKGSKALFSIGERAVTSNKAAPTIVSTLWESLGRTANEITDKGGNTPLHVAACKRNVSITKQILEHAPYMINHQNNINQTALHLSIKHRSISVATILCECKQLNPYLLDKDEKTVLHYACLSGVTELVKPLLKLCSEPRFMNAADVNRDTALHIATREGYTDIMKHLLKKKADKKIKNNQKQTPKDIARLQGNDKAIKRLKKFPYLHRHVHKMSQSSTSPALSSIPSMDSISTYSQASSMCSALAELETDEDDSD